MNITLTVRSDITLPGLFSLCVKILQWRTWAHHNGGNPSVQLALNGGPELSGDDEIILDSFPAGVVATVSVEGDRLDKGDAIDSDCYVVQ